MASLSERIDELAVRLDQFDGEIDDLLSPKEAEQFIEIEHLADIPRLLVEASNKLARAVRALDEARDAAKKGGR